MFCRKCGAEIPDGSVFCDKCGERTVIIENGQNTEAPYMPNGVSDKRNRIIGILAVGVAAVVVIAVASAVVFGGRSSREVVKDFFEAVYEDADADDFMELFPRQVTYSMFSAYGGINNDMAEYYIESELDDMRGGLRGDQRVRYDIVQNDRYDKDELERLQNELQGEYGIKPSDARDITVSYNVGYDGQSSAIELQLIKLGRSWYLIDFEELPSGSIGPVI